MTEKEFKNLKVGGYIKLTKEVYSFNKVGDILKISEVYDDIVGVDIKDHPQREGVKELWYGDCWLYEENAYVVLENYKPTEVKE